VARQGDRVGGGGSPFRSRRPGRPGPGSPTAWIRPLLVGSSVAVGWWSALSATYLLASLLAARQRQDELEPRPHPDGTPLRLTVFVPAHDEESVIGDAVASLLDTDYPPARRHIVVLADNCTDDTASVARASGAEVWERDDPARRGKGQAIAWALERTELGEGDAVVLVDADCVASRNLLSALASALLDGADAAQARYCAANPQASPAAALRYAGFALINSVRPTARARLGLSAGLLGSGMAFPSRTLQAVPWRAFSVTEDREYHLRLLRAGLTVSFVESAWVSSAMPTTHGGGAAQQMRWDTGNVSLAYRFLAPLVSNGIRRGSIDSLVAAVDLLVPPQTVLSAMGILALSGGASLRARVAAALGLVTVTAQSAYVLGGLRLVNAPSAVFRALPHAPALIGRRLAQHAMIATGRGSRTWTRTDRDGGGESR